MTARRRQGGRTAKKSGGGGGGGGGVRTNGGILHGMILRALESFSAESGIRSEYDLETEICGHLERGCGYDVRRQVSGGRGRNRYDIVCSHVDAPGEKVCVEIKLKATASDFEQFDRYLWQFHDGLVVACWSATAPVRNAVRDIADASPVPVGMVEVGMQHALA